MQMLAGQLLCNVRGSSGAIAVGWFVWEHRCEAFWL